MNKKFTFKANSKTKTDSYQEIQQSNVYHQ